MSTTVPIERPGSIVVISGPMFCGKSDELMRRLRVNEIGRRKVQAFKHPKDTRYSKNEIASHSGARYPCTLVRNTDELMANLHPETEVIGIDEGQSLDDRLIGVTEWLAKRGKIVIVSGLLLDYKGEPFHFDSGRGSRRMGELFEIATEPLLYQALCTNILPDGSQCNEGATRSQRYTNGEPSPYTEDVDQVGGEEAYAAVCLKCHTVPGKPELS